MNQPNSPAGAENHSMHRRTFLAATGFAAASTAGLAGCLGNSGDGMPVVEAEPMASPVESTAVSWDDLGELDGDITIYSGRTRDQIEPLFDTLEERYDGLNIILDRNDNQDIVNLLKEEAHSPADLFYSQDSGALAEVAANDVTQELPADIVDAIDDNYLANDNQWMGVSGRVRAILYNTTEWEDGSDALPDDIMEYAYDDRFEGRISTRPNSGTFRGFIAAMIELEGEDEARDWVRAMVQDQEITLYGGGSEQAEAVRNGDQTIALGNQYYAGRILSEEPDAPIDVAFTTDDAGSLFNISGVAVLDTVSDGELVGEFCRHLIAKEAQEFFVETNGEYPVVDGVEYVGELPSPDELSPPDFNLGNLDLELQEVRDLLDDEDMVVGR